MNCNVNKQVDPIEILYSRHTIFAQPFLLSYMVWKVNGGKLTQGGICLLTF